MARGNIIYSLFKIDLASIGDVILIVEYKMEDVSRSGHRMRSW
jgi:hypothetical protein